MMSKVLDAVATSTPEASVTVPSVKATRDPDLTTVPVAVSTPLQGRTALRKFTLISTEVKPFPFGRALCSAEPTAVSRSVQTRPPQTAPTALYADSSGAQVNTVLPGSTLTSSNCISCWIGGDGSRWSMIASTNSQPSIDAAMAAVGAGSRQVTTRDFSAPQPSRTPPLGVRVMALLSYLE